MIKRKEEDLKMKKKSDNKIEENQVRTIIILNNNHTQEIYLFIFFDNFIETLFLT